MERKFMKGNEAIAEAAVRAGCRFFAGYPITPQSEITEYLARRMPMVGGVFVQGESEIASINMVIGAAAAGRRAMTASSNPGMSLKAEGISTLAGSSLPAVIVDIARTGSGTGQIWPGQNQYNFATKAAGHGGFKMIVLAPSTVQEAVELTYDAFDYADRDRNPVMVLADGVIGGMMEAVTLPVLRDPATFPERSDWVIDGCRGRDKRINASMTFDANALELYQIERAETYKHWTKRDVRVETLFTDDATVIVVAYGTAARVARSAIRILRDAGRKVGLIRPIILSPYPFAVFDSLDWNRIAHVISVEMCIPQLMVDDVERAVARRAPMSSFGRGGGVVPAPDEVAAVLEKLFV